ncbi:MAG: peptidoglycan DD-metalloendopeptidase family protein [Bacteroidaceae bacterium]|nr:peptidoglycan DD-metalloendopeptidase family protein [Bacteroidaceae bacterium]
MPNKRMPLALILLLVLFLPMFAQQTSVKDMRSRVKRLQQQIKEKENILYSSEKDVASKIRNLGLLTSKIDEQKSLIKLLENEVTLIDKEIEKLSGEVKRGEESVSKSRSEYAAALTRARRYGTLQDKLLFVVSADDFNSMLRRYRYTREYMNAHRKLADELKEGIAVLQAKRSEIEKVRADKMTSIEERKGEQQTLRTLEEQQRTLVAELKRENNKVKKELNRQRTELDNLNAAIDKAIAQEIEARRKAEERAAQKKQMAAKAEKEKSKGKSGGKKKEKARKEAKEPELQQPKEEPRTEPQPEEYIPSSADIKKLTGSFSENRGRLPVPITGPYSVVNSYGLQRAITGKGNVQIDLGGVTFTGQRGAKARSVFQGNVMGVYGDNEYVFVLISHGSYITVYTRLKNVRVKKGDKVKAGDIIADIATDISGNTSLLFQIRNGKTKLNPYQWLKL